MFNNKPWTKLVKRATEMSWDELRVRAGQEVAKRCDLVLSRAGAAFVKDPGDPSHGCRARFFFDPQEVQPILDFLRRRLPDVVDQIIDQADQICRHRFDLLGYQGVEYGEHIDWHLDAVHAKRAPRRPWFKVRYLDFDQVGDSKITWELNRHQHLVTLAKAYRLTGRPQYGQELFEQWYGWQEQNPYPVGINWASSLEVAFRSLSWLWISRLLQGCSVVPARFPSDLRRALMLNGRHIERFPSTYFSPNTHLLGEGVGLLFIGTLCPGSPAAQRWQHQGWQIISSEAQRQVRADGMHFEHSTYYHTYALDFFLHARVLASLNGIPVPAEFDKAIEKMLEALCSLGSSGRLPRLGDDDGGRVFDPHRNRLEHMLDPLALGAVLFNRSDFKKVAGDIREETIWLSGVEGARRFDDLCSDCPAPVSFALEPSGIHVMSSLAPVARQLVINAGPSEQVRNGHRHADALSVQLALDGDPVLIDPGTFAYVDKGCERNRFRGTAGHNTLHIDGLSQAEPSRPFEWQRLPSTDVNRWVNGNTFDFFEGSHNGYGRLPYPAEHRRTIFFLKPQFWLVRDFVGGAGIHEIGVDWHFADGALTRIPGGVTFISNQQTALGLLFTSSHRWSREICPDWYSPVYGRKEPVPLLRCTARAQLPVELVTLLIPTSTPAGNLGVLESFTLDTEVTAVRAYRYSTAAAADRLFVFATAPGSWQIGPWSSDARFLFCTAGCGEQPDCFVMCDGSYLALSGRRILTARRPLAYAEFFSDGDRQRFRCSHADVVDFDPLAQAARNLSRPDVVTAVFARS
jgi:Heparinase II/III-like protein/Heparinase II/III N-terminus